MRKCLSLLCSLVVLFGIGLPERLHGKQKHNSEQWQFRVTSRQTLELFATFDYFGTTVRFPVARYQNHRHVIWLTSQPGSSDGHLSYVFEGPVVLEHSAPGVEVNIHYKGDNLYQIDLYFSGTKVLTEREIWLVGRGELQQNLVVTRSEIVDTGLKPLQPASSKACNQWDRGRQVLEHSVGYMAPERKLTPLEQEQKEWMANPTPADYVVQVYMMTNGGSDDKDSESTDKKNPGSTPANEGSSDQVNTEETQSSPASDRSSSSSTVRAAASHQPQDQPQVSAPNPPGWCEDCQTVHGSGSDIVGGQRLSFGLTTQGFRIQSTTVGVTGNTAFAIRRTRDVTPDDQLSDDDVRALILISLILNQQSSEQGGTHRCRPEEELPSRQDDDRDDDHRSLMTSCCGSCTIL